MEIFVIMLFYIGFLAKNKKMSLTPSLKAYRSLLRASRIVFNSDRRMLQLSLRQIRTEFEKNRFERDEVKINKLVSDANEAATFLVSSVLQGVREDDGNFKIKLNKSQVETNLDANMTIKGIDEQIESLERRQSRKKKPIIEEGQ